MATTYYIDPTLGSDSNNGQSPEQGAGANGPWKTLTQAGGTTYTTKDRLLLKRGETFRDGRVIWLGGGTQADPVTIGAYGEGPMPIVTSYRVVLASEWLEVRVGLDDLSRIGIGSFLMNPRCVLVDGLPAPEAATLAGMQVGEWFYDSATDVLYFRRAEGKLACDYTIEVPNQAQYNHGTGEYLGGWLWIGKTNWRIECIHFRGFVGSFHNSPPVVARALHCYTSGGVAPRFTIFGCHFQYCIDAQGAILSGGGPGEDGDFTVTDCTFTDCIRDYYAGFGRCHVLVTATGTAASGATPPIPTSNTRLVVKRTKVRNPYFAGMLNGPYRGECLDHVATIFVKWVEISEVDADCEPVPSDTLDPNYASVLINVNYAWQPLAERNRLRGGNHQIIFQTCQGGIARYNHGWGCRADPWMHTCPTIPGNPDEAGLGGGQIVHHNVFHDTGDNCAQIHQTPDVLFCHNVLVGAAGNGLMISKDVSSSMFSRNTGLQIVSNIFYQNGRQHVQPYQHPGAHSTIWIEPNDSTDFATCRFDHNVYWNTLETNKVSGVVKDFAFGVTRASFQEWRNALVTAIGIGWDGHSRFADPKFVNPGQPWTAGIPDFRVTSGSPALGLAWPNSRFCSPDYDGNDVDDGAQSDAGAFHFQRADPVLENFSALVAGEIIIASVPPVAANITMWRGASRILFVELRDTVNDTPVDLTKIQNASAVLQPAVDDATNGVRKRLTRGEIEVFGDPRAGRLVVYFSPQDTEANAGLDSNEPQVWYWELSVTVAGSTHPIAAGSATVNKTAL